MSSIDDALAFGVTVPSMVWRASRKRHQPMRIPPVAVQGTGRFDDPRGHFLNGNERYGVLYCGGSPTASFLEVLAPLRAQLTTIQGVGESTIMDIEERNASKRLIQRTVEVVSNQWLQDWVLTRSAITAKLPLFNIASPGAVQYVREYLSLTLLVLGISDLDFSHVLSTNRELTRAISRWICSMTDDDGEPLFSGIRYRSRFDPESICFALYQDRYAISGDVDVRALSPQTPGLAEAAGILRLSIT